MPCVAKAPTKSALCTQHPIPEGRNLGHLMLIIGTDEIVSEFLHISGGQQLDQLPTCQFILDESCRQKSCALTSKHRLEQKSTVIEGRNACCYPLGYVVRFKPKAPPLSFGIVNLWSACKIRRLSGNTELLHQISCRHGNHLRRHHAIAAKAG